MPASPPITAALLDRLERYYDLVPRQDALVERLGPLELFVRGGGWPYYARPALGASVFTAGDVLAARERMRALGQPETIEWVAETTPALSAAARGAGMRVAELPLMVLDRRARLPRPPAGFEVRMLAPGELAVEVDAAQQLGFAAAGTSAGAVGLQELCASIAAQPAERRADVKEVAQRGLVRRAVALWDGAVVCAGGHKPVGDVTEIVGVATLPSFRRRGLAAAVTAELVRDACAAGVEVVFLSAGGEDVARVYRSIGFAVVATACIAEVSS